VLAVGNTTGAKNILVTAGDRIDAASAAALRLGVAAATSVAIGATTIPVSMPGWLNVGTAALAVAQGDFSAGVSAGQCQFEFDQSERTLSILPVVSTDTCTLILGVGSLGSLRIRSEAPVANEVEIIGLGAGGQGTHPKFYGGSPAGTPGAAGLHGGDVTVSGGDAVDSNGGDVTATGGRCSVFGGPDVLGATMVIGGASTGGTRGGNVTILGGVNSDGFATARPAGPATAVAGAGAGTGDGGDLILMSGANTGTGTAGNVVLGSGATGGTDGTVTIGGTNARRVNVGRSAGLLGFYGAAAVVQSLPYGRTAPAVGTRTLLSSASATPTNTNNVLAAVICDLQAIGLIG
jgi:hypothetical protein